MLNKNAECFQNEKTGLFHNILKVLKKKKQLKKKKCGKNIHNNFKNYQ